jgi:citrate/tricarballylate utilization protein
MRNDLLEEARRQVLICNACRYCEGFCSVFPAMHRDRVFSDGDLTQLGNLCHNCRGCYHACQYTAPHEFNLNLPAALAELRRDSWESFAWPQPLARRFHDHGVAIALTATLAVALMLVLMRHGGRDFYDALPHTAMTALFLPAFLLPMASLGIGLRRFWRTVGGGRLRTGDTWAALRMAGRMQELAAGHGEGCNFEDEDRFSQARRYAHQAILYGFLLCFAATAAGTLMHYLLDWPAPYPFWSPPKLLGVPGGVLLVLGCVWMAALKIRAARNLGDARAWGGEMGFILLLGLTGLSGLALYALGATPLMPALLALHLGAVISFFLLTPFTKMAHGFYRFAALLRDAQIRPGR